MVHHDTICEVEADARAVGIHKHGAPAAVELSEEGLEFSGRYADAAILDAHLDRGARAAKRHADFASLPTVVDGVRDDVLERELELECPPLDRGYRFRGRVKAERAAAA